MKLKKTIGAMAMATLFATMAASAVEKNITVRASVDPKLDLLQADGTSLPDSIALTYSSASNNFEVYSLNTAIHTNDKTKAVVVKLSAPAVLSNIMKPSSQIPMKVTLGGKTLSTADAEFAADTLNFGASGVENVSSVQQLTIHAEAAPPEAGNYQGVISLIMTQKT
ncbi:CS19 fimbria major subunit CsdA [Escherichia coli]|uniref:CsdA n=2 Tax=Escherichia coli TaxID=562 RepID=Q5SGE4_ECOLX|nr:CS19 fimbria major subunit CsdA [Escherichia coli]AAQ19775.1 CsdA [Escherichia coli]EGO6101172.1 CS19 fimbria major subunit CsdA [Escherichia coli]OKU67225.1 fimbrial protein [Escherichia coli]OKU81080.1 fimbrial protein [Escherichia coli]OKW39597.1 fimbrial protein [Escherichia coli]